MYYGFENLCSSEDISHHGILGQKWGVRRYQNPDGTLTSAGKKRYYKYSNSLDLTKKGEKMYKKDPTFRTSHDKRVAEDKARKEKEAKKREAISKQAKTFLNANANTINKLDVFYEGEKTGDMFRRYKTDKEYNKRLNDIADLGIKALPKLHSFWDKDQFEYDDWDKEHGYTKEEVQQSNREWFLWEDQTIGMPAVAELISKGVPAKKVKSMIESAHYVDDEDYDTRGMSVFVFGVHEGDMGSDTNGKGGMLSNFADACEEVKKGNTQKSDQELRFEMQSDPEKAKAFIEKLVRKEISAGSLAEEDFKEAVDYYYSNGRLHDHVVYEYSNKR